MQGKAPIDLGTKCPIGNAKEHCNYRATKCWLSTLHNRRTHVPEPDPYHQTEELASPACCARLTGATLTQNDPSYTLTSSTNAAPRCKLEHGYRSCTSHAACCAVSGPSRAAEAQPSGKSPASVAPWETGGFPPTAAPAGRQAGPAPAGRRL